MSDAQAARRILQCLDLTDLSESCSEHGTAELCAKAVTPLGPVAWSGVVGATAGTTVISVLAPQWLSKAVGAVTPDPEAED